MDDSCCVTARVFGMLCEFQRERGLPAETVETVPAEGISARDLAVRMGLPVDSIEGVFCNHTIRSLSYVIRPGDQIAFVPYGTPGPHRYFLGLYEAGHKDE